MWVLQLNDMRSPKIEIMTPVAKAETMQELERLIEREKVEPYTDGQWGKSFRQGGPLEWFNQPYERQLGDHFVDVGTEEDWASRARERYRDQIGPIRYVET